jgi:hypothetical protein
MKFMSWVVCKETDFYDPDVQLSHLSKLCLPVIGR